MFLIQKSELVSPRASSRFASTLLAFCAAVMFVSSLALGRSPAPSGAHAIACQDERPKQAPRLRGEARKALAAAAKLARVPKGSDQSVRTAAMERALGAFEACAERFAKQALVVAEVRFRRGKLLARIGKTDEACASFARSATLAPASFGARALLEKAHVERRAKRYADALSSYRKASRAIQSAETELAPEAEGDDKRALDVRRRLTRMRARKSLAKRAKKERR